MSTFKDTKWIPTLHLNGVRVLSAAVTLLVLYLVGRLTGVLSGTHWDNTPLALVVALPAALIFGLASILLFRLAAAMGVPVMDGVAGMMSVVMVVFIVVGDPLIWIVRNYYPTIVPVQRFHIINPKAIILVHRTIPSE